ncbi:sphingosine kinase 1-like isoform X1 [Diprion similis]|uniref:sphingosine kinase 1-like isoform X1 n=1 Tax=Diprion similis TaxID=362088 RepID=UPI001EF75F2E|nr:sphingosine kinase 1-like isoform X1 [Diprion similis]
MEGDGEAIRADPVLEETFYITSKKNTFYRVKLTEKGLSLQKESNGSTKTETIALSDIIGCRCMRSKKRNAGSCVCHPGASRTQLKVVESSENFQPYDELDMSAYLYIYSYPMKKPRVKGARRRERSTLTLRFRSFDKYEDNLREASRWRLAIKCLIARVPVPKSLLSPTDANLELLLSACPGEDRKLLVLLNPKSGPGRARETFQRRVHPILSEAERSYDIHITKYPNYARDFVRSKDIYQWSGLLMVGGDGIIFEVVNGLFERPDWEKAVKQLPLGIIPCGSGNGLAKSIAHATQEPFDLNPMLISTLSVVKCKKTPMDLVRVETRNQIMFSFLSVGWGLMSDIDIESEKLRAIGGQRFTIWSLARIIGLRTYKGKVSYLPYDKPILKENGTTGNGFQKDRQPDIGTISHSKSYGDQLDRYSTICESRSYHDAIDGDQMADTQERINGLDANVDEVMTESLALETENHRRRLDSFYSVTSKKSTYYSTGGLSSYQSFSESQSAELGRGESENRIMYGPASTLPALTAALPPTWTQVEGDFIMVHASYQTHLGQDFLFAPRAKLADGVIWLLIIRAGITRAHLLQFLLGLSNGSHLNCPGVEMIPVKAFRIEPAEGMVGYLTVDGEAVDYGPLQAEVFPSLANVMST